MTSKSVWVFDLEANGLLREATAVHCGVFKNLHTKAVIKFRPNKIPKMLKFMDRVSTLIGHNTIGYDFPLLEKLYGYTYKGVKIDTVLMSRLQKPDRRLPFNCPNRGAKPHSVEAWGWRVGRGKVEHNDWESFSEAMLHRCTEDVQIQELIYKELLKEGEGFNWSNAHKLTSKLFEVVQKQEEYGWLVDQPYMDKCISMLTHFVRKIDKVLSPKLPLVLSIEEAKKQGDVNWVRKPFLKSGAYSASAVKWMEMHNITEGMVRGPFSRVSFHTVDLSKGIQTKKYLLEEGWVPDKWNFKKVDGALFKDVDGKLVKTSPKLSYMDSFSGIRSGVGKLIAKRVQASHRKSGIEGWIKHIRPDGRVSAGVSGLAATSRLKHKVVVNVPNCGSFFGRQMRRCFICKEGFVIVGTDSAGCQLRMLAARMGDKGYQEVVVNGDKSKGTDIHTVNQKAAGLQLRSQAKTFIYGFLFGAGDAKIGDIIDGGAKEGKALKERFLEGLPALKTLSDSLTNEWRANAKTRKVKTPWGVRTEHYDGWIEGLDGRPVFISSEHQVLVYTLQSDEAIMMCAAYCMLYKRAIDRGWEYGTDWGYVAFIHDEYQAEVREGIAEDFATLAEQCITDAGNFFNIRCPHEGEASIGLNWCETH